MIPNIDKDIIQMFYELVQNEWRSMYNIPECLQKPIAELIDKNKREEV